MEFKFGWGVRVLVGPDKLPGYVISPTRLYGHPGVFVLVKLDGQLGACYYNINDLELEQTAQKDFKVGDKIMVRYIEDHVYKIEFILGESCAASRNGELQVFYLRDIYRA